MNKVFLDTVGLLASWDEDDQWHAPAVVALDRVVVKAATITTSFVLLECGNAAARRNYRKDVDEARVQLEAAGNLVVPDEKDWEEAWAAYRAAGPGGAGIVDQISFVVMRRLGIRDVFSNDRHFTAAGFNTLF